MLIINLTQRDILSLIVDIGSLFGWSLVGVFLFISFNAKIRTNSNKHSYIKDEMVEKKRSILWGFYVDWSIIKNSGKISDFNSSQDIKTSAEIIKEIK